MKKFFLFFTLFTIGTTLTAQIKVTSTGNVGIGTITPTHKLHVVGDARFLPGWIGLTVGWSSDNYCPAIYTDYNNYMWIGRPDRWSNHIWSYSVTYQNLWNYSDIRLKENIEPCSAILSKIKQIQVYTYNYNDIYYNDFTPEQKQKDQRKRFGVIAQELEEIFPELVNKPDLLSEYYGVDYVGMIPILVEAIKEQQNIIENLQSEIQKEVILRQGTDSNTIIDELWQKVEYLENALIECCHTTPYKSKGIDENNNIQQHIFGNPTETDEMKLYQNAPNPFNEHTSIQCYIPPTIKKVELCIYNMQGAQVKCLTVSEKGIVSVQIQAGHLAAGVYTYLLIGDGKASDAKQMILTK